MEKEVVEQVNRQINKELYSEYLYLSMAAYFDSVSLEGFSSWMKKQAGEEHTHGMKFFSHLVERGERVKLAAIEAPPLEWASPLEAFKQAYKHETEVTASINRLADLAEGKKDRALSVFLNWFISEQVEEEAQTKLIVDKLEMVGASKEGLLYLDKELGKRGKE